MIRTHEVTIGENRYLIAKMPANHQYHLLRRVFPIHQARVAGRIAAARKVLEDPRLAEGPARNDQPPPTDGAAAEDSQTEPAPDAPIDVLQSMRQQEVFLAAMSPTADVLAKMSDEEFDYIVRTCMSVTQRRVDDAWRPMASSGGGLMYEDMDVGDLMQLTWEVVDFNLGPSLRGGLLRVLGIDLASQSNTPQ